MTPKEKAAELVEKFLPVALNHEFGKTESQAQLDNAKQCALIAVDEIINNDAAYDKVIMSDVFDINSNQMVYWCEGSDKIIAYWQQVKQEINGK